MEGMISNDILSFVRARQWYNQILLIFLETHHVVTESWNNSGLKLFNLSASLELHSGVVKGLTLSVGQIAEKNLVIHRGYLLHNALVWIQKFGT